MTTRKRITYGDHQRIAEALGMSLDDDGCAFTVFGGHLTSWEDAPDWLADLNGNDVSDIADEALKRKAVKPVGRWGWERVATACFAHRDL